jgi:hypothetical protein
MLKNWEFALGNLKCAIGVCYPKLVYFADVEPLAKLKLVGAWSKYP